MDRTDRKIARELLHSQGVALVHTAHELYLVAHKQKDGLTDKEHRYLMGCHNRIEEEQKKLSKLTERLRKVNGSDR